MFVFPDYGSSLGDEAGRNIREMFLQVESLQAAESGLTDFQKKYEQARILGVPEIYEGPNGSYRLVFRATGYFIDAPEISKMRKSVRSYWIKKKWDYPGMIATGRAKLPAPVSAPSQPTERVPVPVSAPAAPPAPPAQSAPPAVAAQVLAPAAPPSAQPAPAAPIVPASEPLAASDSAPVFTPTPTGYAPAQGGAGAGAGLLALLALGSLLV